MTANVTILHQRLSLDAQNSLGHGADKALVTDRQLPTAWNIGPFVTVSILAHLALAAVLLLDLAPKSLGNDAIEFDEISVTLVSARDLQPPAPSAASITPLPEEPTRDPIAEQAKNTETTDSKPEPHQPTEAITMPPPVDLASLPPLPSVEDIEAKPPKSDERPPEPKAADAKPPARAAETPPPPPPQSLGGQSTGRPAASRGDIDKYARKIALVVGGNSPRGVGMKGRVVIEFTLSDDGGTLTESRVIQSSGNNVLDQAALAAITKGKYPTPPAGMTKADLTYRVPFSFR